MFAPHQTVSRRKEQILILKDILSVVSFDLAWSELPGNSRALDSWESVQIEDNSYN